jgi:hypothetical protein
LPERDPWQCLAGLAQHMKRQGPVTVPPLAR